MELGKTLKLKVVKKTDFGIYDDVQAHWDFDIPVGSVSQGIQ